MSGHEDPRTLRSREALLDAVVVLVEEHEVADISLTELAAAAGVSRPTVYQHVGDVPAAAAAAVSTRLECVFTRSDAALSALDGYERVRGTLEVLIDELYERRVFYQRTMRGPSSHAALAQVVRFVESRMRGHVLGTHLVRAQADRAEDTITAIAGGVMWLMIRWLGSDFTGPDSPTAMPNRLADLMFSLAGIPIHSPVG